MVAFFFYRWDVAVIELSFSSNINNLEFRNNISLLEDTENELLLEYYKMYSYKCILKDYNEDFFFNSNFKYTNEELDEVILHILEHHKLYSISNINKIIDKSNKKSKYLEILNSINTDIYQKPIENDLRNLLFNNVSIPKTQEYNANREEGKSYLFLSIVLYIAFIAIVLLFCAKDIRNPMMNAALIVPSIVLSKGLCKLILKKKNLAFTLLMFIVSIYLTTFIYYNIFSSIINFGLCFASRYALQTYCPTTPKAVRFIPVQRKTEEIIQPAVPLSTPKRLSTARTTNVSTEKPEMSTPAKRIISTGFTLNEVIPFQARSSIFPTLYLLSPAKRSLRS